MKSVVAGAAGITGAVTSGPRQPSWVKRSIGGPIFFISQYANRSPHRTTGTNLVFGKITKELPLSVTSKMAENGVIFSDGIENDFLEFNSGTIATITVAERKGVLVV